MEPEDNYQFYERDFEAFVESFEKEQLIIAVPKTINLAVGVVNFLYSKLGANAGLFTNWGAFRDNLWELIDGCNKNKIVIIHEDTPISNPDHLRNYLEIMYEYVGVFNDVDLNCKSSESRSTKVVSVFLPKSLEPVTESIIFGDS